MRKLALMGLCVAALGCGSEQGWDEFGGDSAIGQQTDAIVNGDPDTTHQAVVAYLMGGKCSATIIEVQGSTGWALTAAHCLKANNKGNLRQGNSHANGQFDVQYKVQKTYEHPGYKVSGAYDFAVLEFSGANANTPIIPPMTTAQGSVKNGHKLDVVGYGQTEKNDNKIRNHKELNVVDVSPIRLFINQMSGGMCFGDSGGASLFSKGGTEYVAGVNSAVTDSQCSNYAISARVSAVYDSFIRPAIDGTPYLDQTCDQCRDAHTKSGQCQSKVFDCYDDKTSGGCSQFLQCLQGCVFKSCQNKCRLDHPAGAKVYDEIKACTCNTACSTECSTDEYCEPAPACALTQGDPDCNTCMEASCCDKSWACASDQTCFSCFYAQAPGAECDTNEAYQQLMDCRSGSCASSCGGGETTGQGGGSSSVGGAGGADPTTGVGGASSVASSSVTSGGLQDKTGAFKVTSGCAVEPAQSDDASPVAWLLSVLTGACFARRRRRRGACRRGVRDVDCRV